MYMGGDWNCCHVGQLCCAGQGMRPGASAVCRALEFRANCSTNATGLGPHQSLLTVDCRGSCIAETERTLVSSVLSLHPAKLCCYSQHFAGPVWVACCSAVLDSPTNGTCSCMVLPQLRGTLDKETMLPCTDRGSAHNQTNVPLVLSVAQSSARNNAVVSATAGWLNQWARAGVGAAVFSRRH